MKSCISSIIVSFSFLLVSCSPPQSVQNQNTAKSPKIQQVSSGSPLEVLTVSGTQGDTATSLLSSGALKYEIINGITVPPEPDTTLNNATLAGVDVNNNGVRDDVERYLATKSRDVVSFTQGIYIAKSYQHIITSTTSLSKIELDTIYGAILCILRSQTSTWALKSSDIMNVIVNTQDRSNSFREVTKNYNGYFSGDLPACQ